MSDAESAKTVSRILNDELNMQTVSFITTENGKHITDTLEHHTLPSETTMGTTYTKPVRIELSTGKVTELDAVPASKETTTLSGSTKFPGVTETEARVLEQYEASGMDAATIQNAYAQLKKSHEKVDDATTKVEITEKGGSKWSDSKVMDIVSQYVPKEVSDTLKTTVNTLQDIYEPMEYQLKSDGLLKEEVTTTKLTSQPKSFASLYGETTSPYATQANLELESGGLYKSKELEAAQAGGTLKESKFVLTDKGRELQQQVYDKMKNGEWKLTDETIYSTKGTPIKLDENIQYTLAFSPEYAQNDADLSNMKTNIQEIAESNQLLNARIQNTWFKESYNNIAGQDLIDKTWDSEEVKANIGKISEGLTTAKLQEIAYELSSPWVVDNDGVNLAVAVLTGGLYGELPDVFRVVSKLSDGAKIAENGLKATAELSGSTAKVIDFYNYAKDASIAIPDTSLVESLLKTSKISNVAMVTSGNTGEISKALGTATKIGSDKTLQANSLIRKFDAVNTDNTKSMKSFVSEIANSDKDVAKNAMIELYARDPVTYTYVMEQGSKGMTTADRLKLTGTMKEANGDYVQSSIKYVDNLIANANGNEIIAGKLLADEADVLGKGTLNNITQTALNNGTERYNEIVNALENMETFDKTEISTGVTGASKAISGISDGITSLTPHMEKAGVTDWGKYTAYMPNVTTIEDMTRLSNDEINKLAKNISDRTSIGIQQVSNIVSTARTKAFTTGKTESELIAKELNRLDETGRYAGMLS